MRLFKFKNQLDWKYIFVEVFLIFIGINLAIWFNNWNTQIKIGREKKLAVSKIKEELQKNRKELRKAKEINQLVLKAFNEYKSIYKSNSKEIVTTPLILSKLQKKYSNFFIIKDSSEIESGTFLYTGSTYINLELPELTQIAWETTRSLDASNQFGFECLYELESTYNLQKRVENEVEKAALALQKREIEDLMNILEFLNQYETQLDEDYNATLSNLDKCL